MHIERLFPTPVLVFNLNRKFTQDEHDVFLDNASSVTNSSFNHMSTNRNVLDDSRMSEIKFFVQQSIDKYKSNIMKIKTKSELYITESWTVYLNNGQSVHSHNHANSIVSGVLYYNDAKISFVNDKNIEIVKDS